MMLSHLAMATSACTCENLIVHNDTRSHVIKQLSKVSQSKTSHTAIKKNAWLLAQPFPY